MDKIFINNLKLYAYHGVLDFEKDDGQNFYLDITLCIDAAKAKQTDDVADTESYADVIATVTDVFCNNKYNLIEKAAHQVGVAILNNYSKIEAVTVYLKKPEAPIDADFNFVAVEVSVDRKAFASN